MPRVSIIIPVYNVEPYIEECLHSVYEQTTDTEIEEGKKYYEVDFLISDRHKIAPIEVKSSGYKSHKSLDEFSAKYSERIMNRYVIYTKDYKRENGVEYLPVYMTMFI